MIFPLIPTLNFGSWIGLVENIVFLIGVYSYVYNKKIFVPVFWKWAFIFSIVTTLLQIIVVTIPSTSNVIGFMNQNVSEDVSAFWITIILTIPTLIAVYRLGSGKSIIK